MGAAVMARTLVRHPSGTSKWSTVPHVRSRLREGDFSDFSGKVASWQATGQEPACVGPRQRRVFFQSAKGTPAWSPTGDSRRMVLGGRWSYVRAPFGYTEEDF